MILKYNCENCRNQAICKRYEDLKDKIESIGRSEDRRSGWGTNVMIDLGKDVDGLIFELKCDLFQNVCG